MTSTLVSPDFTAVKQRQQEMWASGDYSLVAARIQPIAERLCETADLQAGWRVLDVATGSGNAALAAARSGCSVVGIDYVPALLEVGRRRAAAEGLDVELRSGDAEEIPFADGTFDAVISVLGVMFAPNQERAARELVRVCRPGGTIALANWTPDGFVGEMFRTIGAHVPPPAGVLPPPLWGSAARLEELFAGTVDELTVHPRTYTFRFRSADEFVEFFRRWYGPTTKAFGALEPEGQLALEADLVALVERHDRLGGGGAVAIPAEYVDVTARRR